MTVEAAKLIIEVTAGLVPGTPMPEYTSRVVITSREWQEAQDKDAAEANPARKTHLAGLWSEREAIADARARMLRDPSQLNWVRTDWLWL